MLFFFQTDYATDKNEIFSTFWRTFRRWWRNTTSISIDCFQSHCPFATFLCCDNKISNWEMSFVTGSPSVIRLAVGLPCVDFCALRSVFSCGSVNMSESFWVFVVGGGRAYYSLECNFFIFMLVLVKNKTKKKDKKSTLLSGCNQLFVSDFYEFIYRTRKTRNPNFIRVL